MENRIWRKEVENIFEVHGPEIAIKHLESDGNNQDEVLKDLVKASILYRWQHYEEANELIQNLKSNVKNLPISDQLDWYIVSVGLLLYQEKFIQALEVITEGAQKFPDNIMLKNQLALVNHLLGKKAYRVSFNELIQQFSENPEIMVAYADHLYQEYQNEEAEQWAKKVLMIDENNLKALDLLGYIAVEKKEDQKALEYFTRAAEIWPFNLNRLLSLCDIAMLSKDYSNAEKAYRYALGYYPDNGELNRGFAILLLNVKNSNKNETISLAIEGVKGLPKESKSHLTLAYAYAYNEQWSEAQKSIEEALKYPPIEGDVQTLQKQIEQNLGKYEN